MLQNKTSFFQPLFSSSKFGKPLLTNSKYLIMKRIILYSIWSLFFLACQKPGALTPPANDPPGTNADMLKMINKVRAEGCKCGTEQMPPVPALTWNNKLESAAKQHSDYMKSTGDFSHTQSNGSTVGTRVTGAGYTWRFVAENIASGQTTVAQVMHGWLKSPAHCKNIMSANTKEMGAARSGNYWTQVFASPL